MMNLQKSIVGYWNLFFQLIYAAFFFFRLSQKIEPGTSTPRANASKEDLVGEFSLT